MRTKILITGGAGFIGNRLVRKLQGTHEVFAVARTLPNMPSDGVNWIEQDLTQTLDYARLPPRVDVVIHLAQSRFYKDFPEHAGDIYNVNVASTFQFLEYARNAGAAQFIFTSTGGLYGYSRNKFVESDPVKVSDFYFTSKYSAELLVNEYQQFFSATILRLFFVYGAGQTPTMLIPRLVRTVLNGGPVLLHGDNGILINPIYVGDVVDVVGAALKLGGNNVMNVGGAEILSLRRVAEIIGQRLNRQPHFQHAEHESGNVVADITRMCELTGSPRTSFSEGIAEVCEEMQNSKVKKGTIA
jgi:nucleoside-diphosphate-sugar epimerase